MVRRLSIGLLAMAFAIGPLPANAKDGSAEDLGDVMSISLRDVVKPTIGLKGALQSAGTPNQLGIGGFIPLSFGENSVWFLDALVNVNFGDRSRYSSIGDTLVSGTTLSSSTRLGYRWLSDNRSWMYGINAGYDTRQLATGDTTNSLPIYASKSVLFHQATLNLEAKNRQFGISAYGLIPFGKYGYGSGNVAKINHFYGASPLTTAGADVSYRPLPDFVISGGYYYQYSEKEGHKFLGYPDGSGFKARVGYEFNNNTQAGITYTYDDNFDSRVSADIKISFGGVSNPKSPNSVVILALAESPSYRNIRVANNRYRQPGPARRPPGGGSNSCPPRPGQPGANRPGANRPGANRPGANRPNNCFGSGNLGPNPGGSDQGNPGQGDVGGGDVGGGDVGGGGIDYPDVGDLCKAAADCLPEVGGAIVDCIGDIIGGVCSALIGG